MTKSNTIASMLVDSPDSPHKLLPRLKFDPPCYAWTRNDPRGSEYGIWHVIPQHGYNGVFVTAAYHSTDPRDGGFRVPCFTLKFEKPADFERWVAHTF